jgi:uncharacterized membrane protein
VPHLAVARGPRLLAAIFAVSGTLHLVAPGLYEDIVPRRLPRRRQLVHASGVAELACAVGLTAGARWAGPLSAATLVAVWPANVQMALDATRAGRPAVVQAGLWARVPLQIPLIRTALRAGGRR